MQEKSIDGALLALRKQIIREKREGLAHVEALLALRGVHLPAVLPAKRKDVAGKGVMSAIILEVLSDVPLPLPQIVAHVAHVAAERPELDPDFAYKRTVQVLFKMKQRGLVRNTKRIGWHVVQDFGPDGCLWRLAQ